MLAHAQILDRILRRRLIAVIRSDSSDSPALLDTVQAIVDGGIDIVEITLTTPNAVGLIERLSLRADILVGAGSVLDAQAARAVLNAGAAFCASPVFNPEVMAFAGRAGRVAMPGALTPSEIMSAWTGGADIVKVFPMPAGDGAPYIRALLGPMPHLRLAPSGGVSQSTAAPLLNAGSVALNVGTWLTGEPGRVPSDLNALRERAAALRGMVDGG